MLGGLAVVIILDGLLRSPTEAGYIFYGLILVSLLVKVRPWRKLGAVLAATIALGFAAHAITGAMLIALVQLRGRRRTALLVPAIYLTACVWEAWLAAEPSITRQILIGAILVVMMNGRSSA
ncbi:MAG: hypothetical protein ACRDRJ_34640 [Streptosporangiaceae bacterium]